MFISVNRSRMTSSDYRPLLVWRATPSHAGAERTCSLEGFPSSLRRVWMFVLSSKSTRGDTTGCVFDPTVASGGTEWYYNTGPVSASLLFVSRYIWNTIRRCIWNSLHFGLTTSSPVPDHLQPAKGTWTQANTPTIRAAVKHLITSQLVHQDIKNWAWFTPIIQKNVAL